jgi:hypothetical protein
VGVCRFCGNPAGFLRRRHAECFRKFEDGKREIVSLVTATPTGSLPSQRIADRVREIAEHSFIPAYMIRDLSVEGWSSAVEHSLHDGVLSEEEEKRLMEIKDRLALSHEELERNGAWERVVKAAVIRDLLHGQLPKRMSANGSLPVNLQKGEEIVWAFNRVEYLEDRVRRQYVGSSSGVSIRVMKGVYYRVGAFKGQPIDRTERVHVDTGIVATTNKHIYFVGPKKSLRVPYAKIVSFQPFADGIGVVRDAASAKPQIFLTGDGWFTYNLVTNLAHL